VDARGLWRSDAYRWAIHQISALPIGGSPTLCHGAAGALDLCLDYLTLDPENYEIRDRAAWLAWYLINSQQQFKSGVTWSSEDLRWFCPSLWVGMLGPAYALARWTSFINGDEEWKALLLSTNTQKEDLVTKYDPHAAASLHASNVELHLT
jgi:hypothetical protein